MITRARAREIARKFYNGSEVTAPLFNFFREGSIQRGEQAYELKTAISKLIPQYDKAKDKRSVIALTALMSYVRQYQVDTGYVPYEPQRWIFDRIRPVYTRMKQENHKGMPWFECSRKEYDHFLECLPPIKQFAQEPMYPTSCAYGNMHISAYVMGEMYDNDICTLCVEIKTTTQTAEGKPWYDYQYYIKLAPISQIKNEVSDLWRNTKTPLNIVC